MKLPMPLVCECGFSTMDAKQAYNHAMKHESEKESAYYQKLNQSDEVLDLIAQGQAEQARRSFYED
jgi:hypothetical protein